MRNSQPGIFIGCGTLEPGLGGISSVSRMMLRSLQEAEFRYHAISLLDAGKHGAYGNHYAFAVRAHLAAMNCNHMIYDHVGLARSAPKLPLFKRDYSVWIHGVEVLKNMTRSRMCTLNNAKFVFVNSKFTLKQFEQKYFPLPNANICQLATENDVYCGSRQKQTQPPTVGILSRITNDGFQKGHLELIQAWSTVVENIPSAKLIIGGEGDGLENLRAHISNSPVSNNIELLGRVDGAELEGFWKRTDIFAMPSRVEGFGLVYIEAMQRGIPVIASIHDAGQEVNQDGITSINVNLNEEGALTNALLKLLNDTSLRSQMGQAAYLHWKNNYQFSAFKSRFLNILKDEIMA